MNYAALIEVGETPPDLIFDPCIAAEPGATKMRQERPEGRRPICVVDDDDWVCDSLSVLLETHGFAVRAYNSGLDFLGDERRRQAKCLIVDQHMPGLAGLDVVAELRRQGVAILTILITGRLDPTLRERAEAAGVCAILEKPFPVPRLIELVNSALASRA